MVTLDRQEIIATNKSLRLIKNELETLLEKDIVSSSTFDTIMAQLPRETPLSSVGTPSTIPAQPTPAGPPTTSMASMSLRTNPTPSPAPPAYHTTGPPSLPVRNNPPPPPPPSKPVIAHARALYRYNAADERDLSFERDDSIAVHEYMNADWWMGRCERSGAEGIFPKNYVEIMNSPPGGPNGIPANEKAGFHAPAQPMYAPQQPAQVYPPPQPQQQNPYNASVPPMAVAEGSGQAPQEQGGKMGKGGEMGKKFGKKLGNAAIFGAGATIGSNIVNSIF